MPLSTPTQRELIHRRQIQCDGYERADGLWDIEAHMTDVKTYDMDNRHRGGKIIAGDQLHDMWLRITIDEHYMVHNVEAVIDKSPYKACPSIVEQFKALEGHKIAAGFTRLTRELFSGTNGCTHLRELLGPIATVAFQTTHKARHKKLKDTGAKPVTLNTCHALADTGEVVKDFYPKFYKMPDTEKNS